MLLFIITVFVRVTVAQGCPTNPNDAQCASYTLPNVNVSILSNDLCTQMPYMTTCLLKKECDKGLVGSFCLPFSTYSSICMDMPTMKSCSSYNNQCGNSPETALSNQCKANPPLKSFPSTKDVTRQIFSICNEMNMDGCDKCKISGPEATYSNCDIMQVYTQLCTAMPDMPQCTAYKTMCSTTPSLTWCSSSSSKLSEDLFPPSMLMYFHTGIRDYILFKEWVPSTTMEYIGSLIAVFLFALFYEAFQVYIAYQEQLLQGIPIPSPIVKRTDEFGVSNSDSLSLPTWYKHIAGLSTGLKGFQTALLTSLIRLISASWALLLMLIVMSYNVGMFVAVVSGYFVGSLLFVPILRGTFNQGSLNKDCC